MLRVDAENVSDECGGWGRQTEAYSTSAAKDISRGWIPREKPPERSAEFRFRSRFRSLVLLKARTDRGRSGDARASPLLFDNFLSLCYDPSRNAWV